MKTLELNQIGNLHGGEMDYGDMSCREFWAGVSGAGVLISAVSWYTGAGLAAGWIVGGIGLIGGANC